MPASKPLITGTKHILPFSSLSPLDFERLCLWLVQREGYERGEHRGAAGSEQGRDIVAWRDGEQWAFQCKRVQSFTAATARKEIQKLFDELPVRQIPIPRHYVFAASCLISSEIREQIGKEYGDRLDLHFWAVTELDEKVKKHPDILEEFFQLDTAIEQPHRFLTTLPQRAEHFTGRERELAQLLDMLQPGRAATLVAVGGMGKTALAVEALYNLPQGRFPDGIFFHTFYHQPQAAVCLERICRAFGREPLPEPAQAAGMALADRKALLVLDGAEQADDLRPILNVAGECGVLITTRRRSDAPNYQYFLELTPLAEEQSLVLAAAVGAGMRGGRGGGQGDHPGHRRAAAGDPPGGPISARAEPDRRSVPGLAADHPAGSAGARAAPVGERAAAAGALAGGAAGSSRPGAGADGRAGLRAPAAGAAGAGAGIGTGRGAAIAGGAAGLRAAAAAPAR